MYDIYLNGMLCREDDYNILKINKSYDHINMNPIGYEYDYSDSRLDLLRRKYNLVEIAGAGSDLKKMLRITWFISKKLILGQTVSSISINALDVLNETKHGFTSNCFVVATVLTECFLSLGYCARMVRCLPMDLRFNECHCMVISYVNDYRKFVAFDAALGGYYIDEVGTPLNICEIRERVISKKTIKLRSIFKYDNKCIRQYLTKNMVRFQTHKISKYGNEISTSKKVYINLNPTTLPLIDKCIQEAKNSTEYIYVYNDDVYWSLY